MTSEPPANPPGNPSGQAAGPSPQDPGTPQNPGTRPPAGNSFFAWVRNLGIGRGEDRWIGGVASGIARRTGLDPILVRGLFILLAIFGGVGVLVYGVAWALLPEPDGRIHAEEAGRGHWSSGMTGALVVTALGLFNRPFGMFGLDGEFDGALWALLWVAAVIFLIIWLIGRSRQPGRPADGQHPPGAAPFAAAP
ncbi:PspC domain-containing protein, partial [Arthrobacter sp. GCM10027362]|uniref:PspC domain-containing protein n=1 Tax=Arthrobacter sp. GCM10027362 TaxID=3273379 RepID=UPI003635B664